MRNFEFCACVFVLFFVSILSVLRVLTAFCCLMVCSGLAAFGSTELVRGIRPGASLAKLVFPKGTMTAHALGYASWLGLRLRLYSQWRVAVMQLLQDADVSATVCLLCHRTGGVSDAFDIRNLIMVAKLALLGLLSAVFMKLSDHGLTLFVQRYCATRGPGVTGSDALCFGADGSLCPSRLEGCFIGLLC